MHIYIYIYIYIYISTYLLFARWLYFLSQMPWPESPGLCTAMADIYTALMSVAPGQAVLPAVPIVFGCHCFIYGKYMQIPISVNICLL